MTSDYTLMTPEESALIDRLSRCRMLPGCWDKRFVRDLRWKSSLTDKQRFWLRQLSYRYRRQLETEAQVMG